MPSAVQFSFKALLVAGIALALGACDKEASTTTPSADSAPVATSSTASGPLPKACSLIDAAGAQTILGQPAGLMGDDPENCVWASQGLPGSVAMLMVQISEEASEEDAHTMYEMMVKATGGTPGDQASTIAGLGDEAWRNAGKVDAVSARQVLVRKGRRLLFLNVTGMGDADGQLVTRLESAARGAVAGL